MMAFLKKIFSCKSKKIEESQSDARRDIKKSLSNIDTVIRFVKITNENSYRYLIPSEWMIKILRIIEEERISKKDYDLIYLRNEQFLSGSKLKLNINFTNVCFVTRELMSAIVKNFDCDYVIKIPFNSKSEVKLKLERAEVWRDENFKHYVPRKEEDIELEKVYFFGKEFAREEKYRDELILKDVDNNNNNHKASEDERGKIHILKKNKNFSAIQSKKKNGESHVYVNANVKNDNANDNSSINNKPSAEKDPEKDKLTPREVEQPSPCTIESPLSKEQPTVHLTKSNEIIKLKNNNNNNNHDINTLSTTDKSNKNSTSYSLSSALIQKLSSLEGLNLPPKGLMNPSVYCFMNTCLQCLASIPELNYYFSNEQYVNEKKSKQTPYACNSYRDFVQSYSSPGRAMMAPRSVYKVCHSFLEESEQHDCQEFLRRFLGRIQEELNYNKKYTFPDKITYEKAWIIYREINPSFIDTLFTGLMRSSVKCNRCGYSSYTYDPFLDLSVSIKRKNKETLVNCIDTYFSEEFIDCEYKCSSCKKKTSITKKLDIIISPQILTIQFKRFEEMSRKINSSIWFEQSLDLKSYTSENFHAKGLAYELIAVAAHIGRSIVHGHYIAFGKRNGSWYHFNDSSVDECSESEAISNDAYLLFYRIQ